jgi:hypothetical protein
MLIRLPVHKSLVSVCGAFAAALAGYVAVITPAPADTVKGGAHTEVIPSPGDNLTPEERMNRRFPQKVRVGDLIGLPLQDYDDRVLGHVTEVTQGKNGKIGLIVSHCGWLFWNCREVRVPIETVVILGRHLNLMDIKRDDFLKLATWSDPQQIEIAPDQIIRIGLGRR